MGEKERERKRGPMYDENIDSSHVTKRASDGGGGGGGGVERIKIKSDLDP